MTGYDLFVPYRNYEKSLLVKQSIHSKMIDEESSFLYTVFQTLRDPDADLSIFSSFHEKADMIFITANPAEKRENRYQRFGFWRCILSMYYPYIDVSGYYGAPQNTYCVINFIEDTRRFILDIKGLVILCEQENALLIPRNGLGNGFPFLYHPDKSKNNYTESNDITKEIKNYFLRHESDSKKTIARGYAEYIARAEKTLSPCRSDKEVGGMCSSRMRFRRDISDLFDQKDEDYFKPEWENIMPNIDFRMDRKNVRRLVLGS